MAMPAAKIDNKVKDALDHVRAAAQELHGAISDAAAKRGEAIKADLEAVSQKAKAVTESVKGSMGAQQEATKKHLADAVKHLEATQKHVGEAVKSSGQAFQTSVTKALADARASVQKISEAVAAKRSAASKQTPKK
jgi:fructose-specific phosphotransferase system component IIB